MLIFKGILPFLGGRNHKPSKKHEDERSKTSRLLQLPMDLLQYLKDFLNKKDFHHFLNLSKYPQIMILKSRFLKLNLRRLDAWDYYYNKNNIQSIVPSILYSRSTQLILNFSFIPALPSQSIQDATQLLNLYELTLSHIPIPFEVLGAITNVSLLILDALPDYQSLPFFSNIEEIIVKDFIRLVDVQGLCDTPRVTLSYCPALTDISSLAACTDVTIKSCPNISDLAGLSKVKRIYLAYCSSITDVSPLGCVDDVTIVECSRISDISSFSFNQSLSVDTKIIKIFPSFSEVVDLQIDCEHSDHLLMSAHGSCSHLNRVKQITILHTPNFISLKINVGAGGFDLFYPINEFERFNYEHVTSLELFSCKIDFNLEVLGSIPQLFLIECYELQSLDGLGKPGQNLVAINGCHRIRDYSPLQFISNVAIEKSFNVMNLYQFQYCEELLLCDCSVLTYHGELKDGEELLLPRCRSLTIENCSYVTSVRGLKHIENIAIRACGRKGNFQYLQDANYQSMNDEEETFDKEWLIRE